MVKGASSVILGGRGLFVNAGGNDGMAKGGSGDVLAGIAGALLAQGLESEDALIAGSFVHSLAGDLAVAEKGRFSMQPTDLVEKLPGAFCDILA